MSTKEIKPEHNLEKAIQDDFHRVISQEETFLDRELLGDKQDRRRLPEYIFRENFLPVFSGEAMSRLPEGVTAEQVIEQANVKWLSVAGSPLEEVDVVDSEGNVVFTVPAVTSTSGLNIQQDPKERGVRHLNRDYADLKISSPQSAEMQLSMGLNVKLRHLFKNDGNAEEDARKVAVIRAYYNLPDPSAPKADNQAKSDGAEFMGEMSF